MTGLFPLWHLAHLADWRAAQAAGEYRVSTRGRTLEQEGFIHCSYPHQLGVVARTFYRDDPDPLVVLEVDRDVLAAHGTLVRTEAIGTGGVQYPHLYGPLPVAAVVEVRPVEFDADGNLLVGDPLA